MAKTIIREYSKWGRADTMKIIPIGDIHIGASACEEDLLRQTVQYILDENAYWIGMGDYCDFIQKKDWRFDSDVLADWITMKDLGDLVNAQKNRLIEILAPIAGRCLCLVKGNHEDFIKKKFERDIYSEIVTEIKKLGGMSPDEQLGLDYYGWLMLRFRRKGSQERRAIKFNLHHGFVGGKLAGAKALNMQRWLWNHETDVVIFGHSHNTAVQREAVEYIDHMGNVKTAVRVGCYSGTFLKSTNGGASTYSEVKGYFPLPIGGVEIVVKPFTSNVHNGNDDSYVRVIA